ncbi:MAG: hypothetical protein KAI96_03075 [Thermodesulfovibrionia bacterium]|nr:hypothetical protein [Thermodesulfovibrionia bacterium]
MRVIKNIKNTHFAYDFEITLCSLPRYKVPLLVARIHIQSFLSEHGVEYPCELFRLTALPAGLRLIEQAGVRLV